jgi:hypothetical protein
MWPFKKKQKPLIPTVNELKLIIVEKKHKRELENIKLEKQKEEDRKKHLLNVEKKIGDHFYSGNHPYDNLSDLLSSDNIIKTLIENKDIDSLKVKLESLGYEVLEKEVTKYTFRNIYRFNKEFLIENIKQSYGINVKVIKKEITEEVIKYREIRIKE